MQFFLVALPVSSPAISDDQTCLTPRTGHGTDSVRESYLCPSFPAYSSCQCEKLGGLTFKYVVPRSSSVFIHVKVKIFASGLLAHRKRSPLDLQVGGHLGKYTSTQESSRHSLMLSIVEAHDRPEELERWCCGWMSYPPQFLCWKPTL